jgi:hypothetical protein
MSPSCKPLNLLQAAMLYPVRLQGLFKPDQIHGFLRLKRAFIDAERMRMQSDPVTALLARMFPAHLNAASMWLVPYWS